MVIELDGYGEVEAVATAYTLVVYEQEFKGDLIKDVFGRHEADDDGAVLIDMTLDNWNAELRALYAMVVTAFELRWDRGDAAPNEKPKPFKEWAKGVGAVNMREIASAVVDESIRGFFRTGAAASE